MPSQKKKGEEKKRKDFLAGSFSFLFIVFPSLFAAAANVRFV
jgi:hypothetical protein